MWLELGEERSYPQPGVHLAGAKAGFRGGARPLARRLSGSGVARVAERVNIPAAEGTP